MPNNDSDNTDTNPTEGDLNAQTMALWADHLAFLEGYEKVLALTAILEGHATEIALMAVFDWTLEHTQGVARSLVAAKVIAIRHGFAARPGIGLYVPFPKKASKFFELMGKAGILLTEEDLKKIPNNSKERTSEELKSMRAARMDILEKEILPTLLSILADAFEDESFVINVSERPVVEEYFSSLRNAVYKALDFGDAEKKLLHKMAREHFANMPKRLDDCEMFLAVSIIFDAPKILRFWNTCGAPDGKKMWTINHRGEMIEFPRVDFFSRIQELLFGLLHQDKKYIAPLTPWLSLAAWEDLNSALNRLPDYILNFRQYKTFRFEQSLFIETTTVRLDISREEIVITQPLRFLTTDGFKTASWKDPEWVAKNYDPAYAEDFKEHFYSYFDEFLSLLVDAKISPSRKKAFLWILARSDSWKGAVFGGIFEDRLGIALQFTIKSFHHLIEGAANVGYTSADFRSHWMLVLDDCKDISETLKLADESIRFVPKFGFNSRVQSFTKVLLNAKPDDQPLLAGDTIDEQISNSRLSKHDMLSQTARFVDHEFYLKSPITYLDQLAYYAILFINNRLEVYKSMSPTVAGDCAFAEIGYFHDKYRLSRTVISIQESLAQKAILLKELLRDFFLAFDSNGHPYPSRPFNQASTGLRSAITSNLKLARAHSDGTRALEPIQNSFGRPASLQLDDWLVLQKAGARQIATEFFKTQPNAGVLNSNISDFIRALHDQTLALFPKNGLARLDNKISNASLSRGIAFWAIAQAEMPSVPSNDLNIDAQEEDLGESG